MNKATCYIDGSFCPHYRCGGWAFLINSNRILSLSGGLEQGYGAMYCESYAIYQLLKFTYDNELPLLHIVSDNQNLLSKLKKQIALKIQSNYHRPSPWDLIRPLLFNNTITMEWKSFRDSDDIDAKFVHNTAKDQMLFERQKFAAQV
jgi:ribonuclease HI